LPVVDQNTKHATREPQLLLSRSDRSTRGNKTGSWRFMKPKYEDKTAPCRAYCPAGEDIPRIQMLLAQERFREAWETIIQENPFPAVCGRICFHPCEKGCNRGELDEPLAIHHIERVIGEYAVKEQFTIPLPDVDPNGRRIAIIGGGPSGLSAAYFLNRMGYRCHVYEAEQEAGGLLRWGIPAYRLPLDTLREEIARIERSGVRIHVGKRINRDFIKQADETHHAVFVGCGLSNPVASGIPGQALLTNGLSYLHQVRAGEKRRVSGVVAVIGGGNTAVDVARSLIRMGAEPVILYRRRQVDMPAFELEIEQALAEGVMIKELLSPVAVEKNGSGLILKMQPMKVSGQMTEDGRARVSPSQEDQEIFFATEVFMAIGAEADHAWTPGQGLRLSHSLLVDRGVPVVYGGDLTSPELSVSHAVLSGKQAAMALDTFFKAGIDAVEKRLRTCRIAEGPVLSMAAYLEDRTTTDITRKPVSVQDIRIDLFDKAERQTPVEIPPTQRARSFSASENSLSRSAVVREAARCFSCGFCNRCGYCDLFCPEMAVDLAGERTIDMDYCKGCGVCVEECPVNAMSLDVEGV